MRKRSMKEKFGYWVDSVMSKGAISMIGLLFGITLIVCGIMGLLAVFVAGGSLGEQFWVSLMHTLDGGTLAGDSLDNIPFVILMTISTLCGLFITSILIGIITTGFEERLDKLKKGNSTVIEEGHTVILGFNEESLILLRSLVDANSNHKKQCIVVVNDSDKEEMEEAISSRIHDFGATKVICRSGTLYEEHILARSGVENAASIIVNCEDDTLTIKVLLALSAYLKERTLLRSDLSVTAVVHEKKYVHAAKLAGGERTEVIFAKELISRIIAHTCNQSGIFRSLLEIFDYRGDDLYYESVPGMAGKKFREVVQLFDQQVVFGIYNKSGYRLNPPMDTVITADDQLILLEKDNGTYQVSQAPSTVDEAAIADGTYRRQDNPDLLVLGQNDKLNDILTEYDCYVPFGAKVTIVGREDALAYLLSDYQHLQTSYVHADEFDAATIKGLIAAQSGNVLILTNEEIPAEEADSETLLKLIELHAVKDELKLSFPVTCEIRNSSSQKLAALIGTEDFVVGSNIVSLLAAQVSQNSHLLPLFMELLDENGSELYMRPAPLYVKPNMPVNFHTVTEAAARRSEIAVGYKCLDATTGRQTIVTNPDKREKIAFTENDAIIIIAAS